MGDIEELPLTRWQKWRTQAFLFAIGLKRRMTLGVRGMLIDGEKVYLVRHTYLPGWHFPGGGVEPGETTELAVGREIFEEAGYQLTGRPKLLGLYHNLNPATVRDHVAFYICRDFVFDHIVSGDAEIAEAGWFDISALPQGTTPGTGRRIAEVFKGVETSPVW